HDAGLLPEGRWPKQGRLRLVALEPCLGKRWPLIRLERLVADQHDFPGKPRLPKLGHDVTASAAPTDDPPPLTHWDFALEVRCGLRAAQLSGATVTRSPSSACVMRIWHDSREFGALDETHSSRASSPSDSGGSLSSIASSA